MRDLFRGYYLPTEEEFEHLWNDALIVPDASLLLSLYRYSAATRDQLIDVLRAVHDRLWVPHQAALEYHENRLGVLQARVDMYGDLEEDLTRAQNQLRSSAEKLRRHPVLEPKVLLDRMEVFFADLSSYLERKREEHPDLFEDDPFAKDPIRDELTALLIGRVGSASTAQELAAIYEDGASRYAAEIPPGYRDAAKGVPRCYGDLVLWKQILAKAASASKPVIFATDDDKDDWWWRFHGRRIGPRRELIEEFCATTGQLFYAYPSARFLEEAQRFLQQTITTEAVNEVERVRTFSDSAEAEDAVDVTPAFNIDGTEGEAGFRGPQVCRIVGITYRQLDYWARTNLVRPSLSDASRSGTHRRYSYRDIVELKVIKGLLDAGVSLQSVRRAVDYLRDNLRQEVLTASLVVGGGDTLITNTDEELVEHIREGAGVMAIVSLAGVMHSIDEQITELGVERPPD